MLEATITAQSVQPQGEIPEKGRKKRKKEDETFVHYQEDLLCITMIGKSLRFFMLQLLRVFLYNSY